MDLFANERLCYRLPLSDFFRVLDEHMLIQILKAARTGVQALTYSLPVSHHCDYPSGHENSLSVRFPMHNSYRRPGAYQKVPH